MLTLLFSAIAFSQVQSSDRPTYDSMLVPAVINSDHSGGRDPSSYQVMWVSLSSHSPHQKNPHAVDAGLTAHWGYLA